LARVSRLSGHAATAINLNFALFCAYGFGGAGDEFVCGALLGADGSAEGFGDTAGAFNLKSVA